MLSKSNNFKSMEMILNGLHKALKLISKKASLHHNQKFNNVRINMEITKKLLKNPQDSFNYSAKLYKISL